jgi:hypothetical protein
MAGAPRAAAGRAYELQRGVARGVTAMVVGSSALLGARGKCATLSTLRWQNLVHETPAHREM